MRRGTKPAEKRKTIPFRPTKKQRDWLEAEKDDTGAPFQKIIEKALDEYSAKKRGA